MLRVGVDEGVGRDVANVDHGDLGGGGGQRESLECKERLNGAAGGAEDAR